MSVSYHLRIDVQYLRVVHVPGNGALFAIDCLTCDAWIVRIEIESDVAVDHFLPH